MHIYLIPSPNIGLGVETDKFHKFWWIYVFSRVYLENRQGDLNVRINHTYPWRNQHQKVPEDTRRQTTEGDHERLTCGAAHY